MTQIQKDFIAKISPLAVAGMKKTNIPASLCIAQACLESDWGRSETMKNSNALFGIKAGSSWKGKVYSSKTKECYDGVNYTTITDLFRAYSSVDECVADYFALLSGADRYKNLIGEKDYKTACRKIREDGYATAPNYTSALISIIETYGLTAYDICDNSDSSAIPAQKSNAVTYKPGQAVKILPSAVRYTTGQPIPARLKGATDTVFQISKDKRWNSAAGEFQQSVLLKNVYSWFWATDVEMI